MYVPLQHFEGGIVSVGFLLFLIVSATVYYLINSKLRSAWLIICSIAFISLISDNLGAIFAVAISALANFTLAILNSSRKKIVLFIAIFLNVAILIFAKVLALDNVLLIGISYYTFSQISYQIDIQRGKDPERNFFKYFFFVSFFPKFVAGPIERGDFITQIQDKQFDYRSIESGFSLILFGFLKKLLVSGLLGSLLNPVFGKPEIYSGPDFMIATILFAFQIYFDFSAYTDIARGTARIFGYELRENFKSPYLSKSISEFWTKWHMSLTSFVRDYIYIPLGGNRSGILRTSMNQLLTLLIIGAWHGLTANYIVWGFLNGVYLIIGNYVRNIKLPNILKLICVFIAICSTWVFFRAKSINDGLYIYGHMFTGWNSNLFNHIHSVFGLDRLVIIFLLVTVIEFVVVVSRIGFKFPTAVRWACFVITSWVVLILLFSSSGIIQNDFIYAGF